MAGNPAHEVRHALSSYLLRRIGLAVITIIGVSFLTFSSVRLIPGDVVDVLSSGSGVTHVEGKDALRRQLGLDRPLPVQYVSWMSKIARGDFGRSLISNDSVAANIKSRLPVSFELGIIATLFAVLIGVPIGIISAIRQDSWLDYALRSLSVAMLAIPGYWIATLMIVYGAIWFGWTPPIIYIPFSQDPWGNIRQFLLPAALLGITGSASLMRLTRTTMLEVLRQDYVRTASSKGLSERAVVIRHALRNAMIPIVTLMGLSLATIAGGTVIFEQIFNLPGMGRYLFLSVNQRDYPAVQGVVLVFALIVVLANLLTDIAYGVLDPRIRYQ
jgi:peptide/nickel transport system permease protein